MPIAVEAVPIVAILALVAAGLALAGGPWAAAPAAVLCGFVLYFFRDPERTPPPGDDAVLAPADGRVVAVEREPRGVRVSIFLSLFDVHINRSPVAGTVSRAVHTRGRFLPAWQARASRDNERNHLEIAGGDGRIYGITQIAGVVARRIVCRKRPGDRVGRGERIGLIRFGSRTDLCLPPGVETLVRVGDRVRGGLTIMARAGTEAAARPAAGERR